MQFNNNFTMKDLFMNKELKNLFPQFTKKDGLKNVYSFDWVDKKVRDYIKSTFGGYLSGDDIVIKGKFKDKFREIKALKNLIEDIFNNMPAITKNVRKNSRLITPFQCIDQLKSFTEPSQKIMAMQIILDNLNYNPDFQSQNRFDDGGSRLNYYQRQTLWMREVGYEKFKKR